MDIRSKNRIKKHEPHGWIEKEIKEIFGAPHRLMICRCGWSGWISVN